MYPETMHEEERAEVPSKKKRTLKNIYIADKYLWVLEKVAELAEEEDRSFSRMLILLLIEALKARGKL